MLRVQDTFRVVQTEARNSYGSSLLGQAARSRDRTCPLSCQGVEFDPQEVLGRSYGPTVGRMRLLAT